jgi:hypothetical protein
MITDSVRTTGFYVNLSKPQTKPKETYTLLRNKKQGQLVEVPMSRN